MQNPSFCMETSVSVGKHIHMYMYVLAKCIQTILWIIARHIIINECNQLLMHV